MSLALLVRCFPLPFPACKGEMQLGSLSFSVARTGYLSSLSFCLSYIHTSLSSHLYLSYIIYIYHLSLSLLSSEKAEQIVMFTSRRPPHLPVTEGGKQSYLCLGNLVV